jgi:PASTA domain/IPT/TIG domain
MNRARRASVATILCLLALPAVARAGTMTIGELAPPSPPAICGNGEFEIVPGGASVPTYRVPGAGLITSWSTNAAAGPGQLFSFKVYRPLGGGNYLVVGRDGPRSLTGGALNTFPTSIPVQAGDLIGDNDENADFAANACYFNTGSSSDTIVHREGNFNPGATFLEEGHNEFNRPNVSATFVPAPTVSAISPTSGSVTGGIPVVITGTDLAGAQAVAFGSEPAASFRVDSEGQITASTPPTAQLGTVPVTVTTLAGTATAVQGFTYQGCRVPKLAKKKLKAAKKALRRAGCGLGKVKKLRGATGKTGRVIKQRPKAGKVVAPGTKVSVKLRD